MVNFGELHLAKVYYRGTKGPFKERPVLIVDDSEKSLVTFAEITGTGPSDPPKYYDGFKVEIVDWQAVGLNESSWVKCHIGNVHRVSTDRMIHKIGIVNTQVMIAVLNKIVNQ